MPELIILIVASAMIFAPVCSWLALQRGRSWAAWFGFGILLGPVAVAILLSAPPGRCPSCGTRSRGWPRRCEACGLEFASGRWDVGVAEPEPSRPQLLGATPDRRSNETGIPVMASRSREPSPVGPGAGLALVQDAPEHRSATDLGRRATLEPTPTPSRRSNGSVAILGSAIFVGGTEPLQIGSRYFIARVGPEVQILGPMHISPSAVATRMILADIEATVVSDRLLITGRDGGNPTIGFSGVAAQPGVDLQDLLVVPPGRAVGAG